ncbi:aldolase/citrate lyase family protein [Maribacter luteus]|uniref:HpcH/HpaI aldolase/citrate lyase domain-containing protein n=1 Tax=Maribacter luteus TaxID=2594478 RepID=A0A6I2MKL4_9FLAO|nr:aldolase/citrate lyase family protein [Maribacter luteus]MRX64313.1 hypothetical protein [Maribacter luteus]
MESFFFVPATKMNKIQELRKLKINTFIIDFEDAIKASQRSDFFFELDNLENSKDCYLRVPIHNLANPKELDLSLLKAFMDKGFSRYVLPKINSVDELDLVLKILDHDSFDIILLVETPKLYLELLSMTFENLGKLTGIGLGSHDFMSIIGAKHQLDNLEIIRQNILYLARAWEITAIDIASMELNNETSFKKEIIDGHSKGFDAKFIIHPNQYKILNSFQFYTEEEYLFALKVDKVVSELKNSKEFNPILIDGKIIEQPHLNKIKKILKNYRK